MLPNWVKRANLLLKLLWKDKSKPSYETKRQISSIKISNMRKCNAYKFHLDSIWWKVRNKGRRLCYDQGQKYFHRPRTQARACQIEIHAYIDVRSSIDVCNSIITTLSTLIKVNWSQKVFQFHSNLQKWIPNHSLEQYPPIKISLWFGTYFGRSELTWKN